MTRFFQSSGLVLPKLLHGLLLHGLLLYGLLLYGLLWLGISPTPAQGDQSPLQQKEPDLLLDWLRTPPPPGARPLPLDFAHTAAPQLAVSFHDDAEAPLAWVVPVAAAEPSEDARRGTLLLHSSYLQPDREGLKPLHELPVDAAEQLLHVLLEVHLDQLWPAVTDEEIGAPQEQTDDETSQRLRDAAQRLLPELTPAVQREAYLSALADFGSHLLSIANEVERLFARRGSALCRAVDVRHSLFGLWNGAFTHGRYSGRYYKLPESASGEETGTGKGTGTAPSRHTPSRGQWVETAPLTTEDKRLLVDEILKVAWSGEARLDLAAHHCPSL